MTSFLPRLVGVGSVKLIRSFHRSCQLNKNAYEGDGKTTVTILNRDADYGLMIDGITTSGFKLNNGLWVLGPMIIFPRSVIGWNIASSNDISEDSLSLFKILEPTIDILVVGLDQKYDNSTGFIQTLKSFTKKQNRYVAGALLPPRQELPKGLTAAHEEAMRRNLRKPEKFIDAQ